MQKRADGFLLNLDEAKEVAKVLKLGRRLCEDLEAPSRILDEDHLEVQLLEAIDVLEDRGVSSDELIAGLDSRPGSV